MTKQSTTTELIRSHVGRRIAVLSNAGSSSYARAMRSHLASSSRGLEDPDVWGAIFDNIDPSLTGNGKPSIAEQAIAATLIAFSRHHKVNNAAQRNGVSLGRALGEMFRASGKSGGEEASGWSYYRQLVSVDKSLDVESQLVPINRVLRLIISQKTIPLDYPKLAADITALSNPNIAHNVLLNWGRDYWNVVNGFDSKATTSTNETN